MRKWLGIREDLCANGGGLGTRLDIVDRWGATLAAAVLLLLLLLLLLLVGACHLSDTVPPVPVANLHMHTQ